MHTFTGLVFVKQGRVGSRSEGPDYYLQTTSGDFLLHKESRYPWQPDYHLEFYVRRMVEVQGLLQAPRLIEVKDICEVLAARLPRMKPTDEPHLGEPVQVEAGESVRFAQGPTLMFQKIAEDSRCPPGASCIWEGRAVLDLRLDVPGQVAAGFSLTLQAGHPDLAETIILGYKVVVNGLEPAGKPAASAEYIATLMVAPVRQVPATP